MDSVATGERGCLAFYLEVDVAELKREIVIRLEVAIDETHALHVLIDNGELKIVSISDSGDPEATAEDMTFKRLQPLAEAVTRMTAELRRMEVPHG